ncbi:SAP domain-containing ribonucleoprotein isoform X1 [Salmo salar]|uniref:SAP domain-containing ribonucleoprotein isoform X1 n=2 Tax=Salmo salar TaxID=8030 RepID=A0A1S3P548_SALSA|nr:SAP domain-containing ribonucleoprotein isoform X1 [Salmo salar]|eukprot:XP_014022719.1 PREDICTED: SAP domain-containing ribonucleoprotein-like isoform X1 [Salmo salar]
MLRTANHRSFYYAFPLLPDTNKMADVVEIHKLKLAELKQECAVRGLEVKGNKGDLIGRLQAYLEEHEDEVNEEEVLGELEDDPKEEEINERPAEEAAEEAAVPEKDAEKKVVKITAPAAADEKLQKRAERFNLPATANSKKEARAARFGLPVPTPASILGAPVANSKPAISVEVLKKRAERFGMNVSPVAKTVEVDEKLKKRKERFGILTAAAAVGAEDSEAKKRKRAERFGNN